MSVTVVVPWRAGCPHRERALAWVCRRYAELQPGWEVVIAEAPADEWVKARAVMPAVAAARSDIVVMADADVWSGGLEEAVRQVEDGVPWAMPHQIVHRLSQKGTEAVLCGEPWEGQELDERPYPGMWGGGYVVATKGVMLSIPLDARFVGWG